MPLRSLTSSDILIMQKNPAYQLSPPQQLRAKGYRALDPPLGPEEPRKSVPPTVHIQPASASTPTHPSLGTTDFCT